jgi:hypothetical protein
LSGLMQTKGMIVLDPEAFRPVHRAYLWTHTAQWAMCLVFVALTLTAWWGEDRAEK